MLLARLDLTGQGLLSKRNFHDSLHVFRSRSPRKSCGCERLLPSRGRLSRSAVYQCLSLQLHRFHHVAGGPELLDPPGIQHKNLVDVRDQ